MAPVNSFIPNIKPNRPMTANLCKYPDNKNIINININFYNIDLGSDKYFNQKISTNLLYVNNDFFGGKNELKPKKGNLYLIDL